MENIDLTSFEQVWQRVTEAEDIPMSALTEASPAEPVLVFDRDTPHAVRFIPQT